MIEQTNSGLLEEIQEYGCYYLSILHLVECLEEKEFTVKEVNEDFTDFKYLGVISDEAFIEHPAWIFRKYDILVDYLGAYKLHKYAYGELEVLKFHRPGMVHFVVGDGRGNVLWDPYPNSRTVREGKVVDRRILRVKVA